MNIKRKKITVTGRIQGVGFRPAVYNLATELHLTGFVFNDTKGVTIEVQGNPDSINSFLDRLTGPAKPPAAEIKTVQRNDIDSVENEKTFIIKQSRAGESPISEVTIDMAVCGQCLAELNDPHDFRYHYPFTNCTNCGPRYSIVKTIPYDRGNTTMAEFQMCGKCEKQYRDVTDRRFHAQPVACPDCGPSIKLTDNTGKTLSDKTDEVIEQTAKLLAEGKILAIKGIGGFHLAVNAHNEKAVNRLRERKHRESKPFALMADSIETIKKYAEVDEQAEDRLKNPQAPIVLLTRKENIELAPSVAQGVNTLGFMLCYAPLHWLLFKKLNGKIDCLVMTSGNISEEPIAADNDEAPSLTPL